MKSANDEVATELLGAATQGVKRAAVTVTERVTLSTFYLVCASISIIGNSQAAEGWLTWPLPFAFLAVSAVEFGGVVLSMHADKRRELGEKATATRVLSAVVALGAVLGATLGHIEKPGQAAFFGGMSALGYAVYLIHSGAKRRDALRARGELPEPGPQYGPLQWIRHPLITAEARALDRGTDDRIAASLSGARAERRNAKARSAAERIARKLMEEKVGKDEAALMLTIVPFDGVVERAQNGALERSGALVEQVLEWSTLPSERLIVEAEVLPDTPVATPVEHSDAPVERSGVTGAEWSDLERSTPERSGVESSGTEQPESGAERSNVVAIRSGAAEAAAAELVAKYGATVADWPSQKKIAADMKWGDGKVNRAVKAAKEAA